jgi:hypothetical protein
VKWNYSVATLGKTLNTHKRNENVLYVYTENTHEDRKKRPLRENRKMSAKDGNTYGIYKTFMED